ncbi:uncharacterized protein DUF4249 [Flavobacteriaceae bacterium MAR_2010_72]|nr:uncharacterized protein DUF4249 [Flavobacteriaceae bacterium MAR_2010_72]
MKHYFKILFLSLILISCEDVIDLNLNNSPPRLVIDASINWLKGTNGMDQDIKLSLTAPYFNNDVSPANGAIVYITDSANNQFDFVEDGNTGIYRNNDFIPTLNETYSLFITYSNQNYLAIETLKPVVPIQFVEQKDDGGFSGDEIELKAFYTDPEDEENYYFFEFINQQKSPSLEVYKDEFTNGNQIFGFYSDEDIKAGDEILIRNSGISKRFYEFMFILLQQNSDAGGGPFETQPATVRGNCINTTNPENFPLGYFRLSEVSEYYYTIQ